MGAKYCETRVPGGAAPAGPVPMMLLSALSFASASLEAALAACPAAEVSGASRSVLVETAFRNPLRGDAGLEMIPSVSMQLWGSPAGLTPTSFTTESQYCR